MKKYLRAILVKRVFQFSALMLASLVLILVNLEDVHAAMPSAPIDANQTIIEHLRLHVDREDRQAWLEAERGSWGKWLTNKSGFLERKLYWDPLREEATLMIAWASYSQWKAIPQGEIEAVQERFEALARQGTGRASGNPLPLVYEGELIPQ